MLDHVVVGVQRLDGLTGLRWWAALAVFGSHTVAITSAYAWVAWIGWTGVAFFYTLSGFVLAWSAPSRDTRSAFYRRRFARIYPLHLVGLALAIPVMYSADGPLAGRPLLWAPLLLAIVLLQAWFPFAPTIAYAANPADGSLSAEAFYYGLFPLLERASRPVRGWLALAVGGLVWPWLLAAGLAAAGQLSIESTLAQVVMRSPIGALGLFLTGIGLSRAVLLGWRPRWSALGACAILVLCVAALLVVPVFVPGSTEVVQFYLVFAFTAPAFAAIIASVACAELAGRRGWLSGPRMVALGRWSFAFYLVHATVLYGFRDLHDGPYEGPAALAVIALALALAVLSAALLHRYVEAPAERRLRRGGAIVDLRTSQPSASTTPTRG